MITKEDYFGKMSHLAPPSDEVVSNADNLLMRVNALMAKLAYVPQVNSGWRPEAYNVTVPGAAAKSKHITGQAIDLRDEDGWLDDLLFNDPAMLEKYSLWMEHPAATKGWCHLQSVPPRSGSRVFFP